MIARINKIKNVGKFEDFAQPVELGKLTLIYAENGRGKSTLADILRSLCTGKQERLLGRRTHGSKDSPDLELAMKNGESVSFQSDRWITSAGCAYETDDIIVFDDVFINENVYSGNTVDTPHRRNLASLVIGDTAVRYQQQEDALNASINDREARIKQLESEIAQHIHPYGNNPAHKPAVRDFVNLPVVADVDFRISEEAQLVRQIKELDAICSNEDFVKLPVIHLPIEELEDLLRDTLDKIHESAERKVLDHIQQFSSPNAEHWLDAGTALNISDPTICPFCGQRLKAGHLLEHYRSYFNKEYKKLKTRIANFSHQHLQYERQLADINRNLEKNTGLFPIWRKELSTIRLKALDYQLLQEQLSEAKDCIDKALFKKRNAPLETFKLEPNAIAAIGRWKRMAERTESYNRLIVSINTEILSLKQKLRMSNLEAAERREQNLHNSKCRHENDVVVGLCNDFISETKELDSEKRKLRETRVEKNQVIADLFKDIKDGVNRYLGKDYFDVEFKLSQFEFTRDKSGERVEAYALEFPAGVIPIGKSDALLSDTSFKNTLSAGDRATLSFAMFLAHVDSVPDPSRKLLVIDDPISSMDANRRWSTYEAISELCDKDGQVIILSHSPEFLHTIWEEYGSRYGRAKSTRRLRIRPREGAVHASEIEPNWDSESFLINRHRKRIARVELYADGDMDVPEDVGKCLRQIVEHHYKDLYPRQYTAKLGSFGAFLGCVRQAKSGSILSTLKDSKLDELEKTNRFLRGLHHDDDAPFPSETELRSRCRKVLSLIRNT